jgi:hypothetical protein
VTGYVGLAVTMIESIDGATQWDGTCDDYETGGILILLSGLIRWGIAIACIVSGHHTVTQLFYTPAYFSLVSVFSTQQTFGVQVLSCCLVGCCCNEDKSQTTVRQVTVGAVP